MARRTRLDAELVRRGLARSRQQAAALVSSGRVEVRGSPASKPAAMVDPADPVRVLDSREADGYVSRGAHKLAGAAEVVAVDVGYGQLAWSLRTDPRVRVVDRTNVRTLPVEVIGGPVALTVADLSFISLRLVLPALTACTEPDGGLVLMVKPQFEVGRERVGVGGVVREPALRAEAVLTVARAAQALGWGTAGLTPSPLPGPAGNVEYFLWLRRDAGPVEEAAVREATS